VILDSEATSVPFVFLGFLAFNFSVLETSLGSNL